MGWCVRNTLYTTGKICFFAQQVGQQLSVTLHKHQELGPYGNLVNASAASGSSEAGGIDIIDIIRCVTADLYYGQPIQPLSPTLCHTVLSIS